MKTPTEKERESIQAHLMSILDLVPNIRLPFILYSACNLLEACNISLSPKTLEHIYFKWIKQKHLVARELTADNAFFLTAEETTLARKSALRFISRKNHLYKVHLYTQSQQEETRLPDDGLRVVGETVGENSITYLLACEEAQ